MVLQVPITEELEHLLQKAEALKEIQKFYPDTYRYDSDEEIISDIYCSKMALKDIDSAELIFEPMFSSGMRYYSVMPYHIIKYMHQNMEYDIKVCYSTFKVKIAELWRNELRFYHYDKFMETLNFSDFAIKKVDVCAIKLINDFKTEGVVKVIEDDLNASIRSLLAFL